jgi:hypothetical protein
VARLASALARDRALVGVMVNGGTVAVRDAGFVMRAGGRVLAIAGTGRAADRIAATVRGAPTDDDDVRELVGWGAVEAADAADDGLAERIDGLLSGGRASWPR